MAATAAAGLNSQLAALAATSVLTAKSLDLVEPHTRKLRAGFGVAAAGAADFQKTLSSFNATQAITGQSTEKLGKTILAMSRQIPVGTQAITATVSTVTQLGVALKGQEAQVASLSKTFQQLQGANGGFAPAYATGLSQLERTFGDSRLDPKKVRDTADSLTYVSKMAGAGAQSVLDFSNAIGPIANAAGISKVATLGISAGFARIGQDGTYAATAVSKVLSDLNDSVRYGGPQLNTYANIVGTTATNFERIYKANPARALNQVLASINQAGAQGPYLLQSLGLDGIRTQRALTAVSAQGGTQKLVDTAIAGYGNGSTAKASDAAYNNVVDNFAKAAESAKQLGTAFGEPLLRPLGTLSKVLSAILGPVAGAGRAVLNSPVIGTALAYGLPALGAARLLGRTAGTAIIGNQLLRSGPISAFNYGRRAALGAELTNDVFGRPVFGRPGVLGSGAGYIGRALQPGGNGVGPLNSLWLALGGGVGRAQAGFSGGGPGVVARLGQAVRGGARFAFQYGAAANRSGLEPDPTARRDVFRQGFSGGSPIEQRARALAGLPPVDEAGKAAAAATAGLRGVGKEAATTGGVFRSFSRYAGGLLLALPRIATAPGVGSSLARIGGGLAGFALNPAVLATVGVLAAPAIINAFGAAGKKNKQAWETANNDAQNLSSTQFLDVYNQALGRATQSTSAFANAMDAAKASAADQSTIKSSTTISESDIQAAASQKGQKFTYPDQQEASFTPKHTPPHSRRHAQTQTRYKSAPLSSDQVANFIRAGSPDGIDPGQLQAIKLDLIKQYGSTKAQQILNDLHVSPDGKGYDYSNGAGSPGRDAAQTLHAAALAQPNVLDEGRPGLVPAPNKALSADVKQVFQGYRQTADDQAAVVGNAGARQGLLRNINAGAAQVAKEKNATLTQEYVNNAWAALGQTGKPPKVTVNELNAAHGDLVSVLVKKSPEFKTAYQGDVKSGITLTGPGQPAIEKSNLAQSLSGPGSGVAGFQFDNTLGQGPGGQPQYGPSNINPRFPKSAAELSRYGASQKATTEAILHPEDPIKMENAVNQFVKALLNGAKDIPTAAGRINKGLGSLQTELGKAGDNTAQSQVIQGEIARLRLSQQALAPYQTSGEQAANQLASDKEILKAGPGKSTASKEAYAQAQQDAVQQTNAIANQLKAQLQTYRSYQIQVFRATQSFQLQTSRANEDFQTQQLFAEQDYLRQRQYAYEDTYKAIARQQRDFNIQLTQAEEDYHHSVYVANRDFNIQLQRQIVDQAQATYSPYKRIQTQAIWDGQQLVANLAEQNAALGKQKGQLDQARRLGLNNNAIQQLQLNTPENAQQLSKLISDFASDPKLIKQLNAAAGKRLSVGSLLITDPSNKDIKRAKEDFARELEDMKYAYDIQIKRAKEGFQRNLADEYTDFSIQLNRQQAEFSLSVDRANVLFNLQMVRLNQDFNIQLSQMKQDVIEATSELTIATGQLWEDVDKVAKGKINEVTTVQKNGLADTLKIVSDSQNVTKFNDAYKNIFPYDLSKVFGGPAPGVAAPAGGPYPGVAAPHGGPYAPYANAGAQMAMFNGHRTGGMGTAQSPMISQGYGPTTGGPNTGGGWPVGSPLVTQGYNPGVHPGIDLAVPRGTEIHAPLPGVVVYAGWNDGYGNCVIMDNGGGRSTLYGHQQAIAAHVGDNLKAGDLIGFVDSTGNSTGDHLHFETRINGLTKDPASTLPIWEATAGLGSFDPGATAAAYGVMAPHFEKLKKKDYFNKHYGPWGALIETAMALHALSTQSDNQDQSLFGNINLPGATGHEDAKAYARSLFKAFGWSDNQFGALDQLWTHESGWNPTAGNPSSGAYGIPQALPANKMASEGTDWQTDFATQVRWGLKYIKNNGNFNDPESAWAFWQRRVPINGQDVGNWYGTGGIFPPGQRRIIGVGDARTDEVLTPMTHAGVTAMARAMSQVVSPEQLGHILTPGSADRVTYVSQICVEDHSVNFPNAHLEVVSQDPTEMARLLEARGRSAALTRSGSATSRRP